MLTVSGALTDGSAGLAGVRVPRDDLDLHAVLGVDLQVGQSFHVLLDVLLGSGL